MFEVLSPSCKKQDFSKAFCLSQALGFVYPAILRNNVDVFCIVEGRGLPYSPELLWGQPVGLCLPCVPSAADQHPAPAGSALGLSVGHCRHCLVPCLAPWACCCSPFSPDPHKASSGTVEHFDGASVPLPGEHEKENFAMGVYCGGAHWLADALGSQEGGEQQQCEAARPNLPGTAIWLLKYYWIASCWWARGLWLEELGKRDGR